MKTVQRIIFILGLLLSVIFFVYTLAFSTGWALGESFGDFYDQAQIANHKIYEWGLWTLIFAGGNLLFHSHTNRKFYIINLICIGVSVFFMIQTANVTLANVPPLKPLYEALNIDPMSQFVFLIVTSLNMSEYSTLVFDFGVFLAYALYFEAAILVLFSVYKVSQQTNKLSVLRQKNAIHHGGESSEEPRQ